MVKKCAKATLHIFLYVAKAKPIARWGRKATDLSRQPGCQCKKAIRLFFIVVALLLSQKSITSIHNVEIFPHLDQYILETHSTE